MLDPQEATKKDAESTLWGIDYSCTARKKTGESKTAITDDELAEIERVAIWINKRVKTPKGQKEAANVGHKR